MTFDLGDVQNKDIQYEYDIEIVKAGITNNEYDGKVVSKIVLACKTVSNKIYTKTIFLSMGKGVYSVDENTKDTIQMGSNMNLVNIPIHTMITSGPSIPLMTKAGLFISFLKDIGVDIHGGDMKVFEGLTLKIHEMPYNDVINMYNENHPDDKQLQLLKDDFIQNAGNVPIPIEVISKKPSLQELVLQYVEEQIEVSVQLMVGWCTNNKHNMKKVFAILDNHKQIDVLETCNGEQVYRYKNKEE